MEEIMKRYMNEEFFQHEGTLDFSCPKIEINIKKGQIFQASFCVTSQEEAHVFVHSKNRRITCDTQEYKGMEKEIKYQFDSAGLEEGEVIKGEISFVSDKGEYYLPFVAAIEHSTVPTSVGNIKNLFHFANLAKTDWLEAVQIFYSEAFADIFAGNDKKYFSAYRGLRTERGNQRNMDEFLIKISKKQAIEYMITEEKIELENPTGIINQVIHITKNGWGATYVEVLCEGSFLTIEKNKLTDDEFLGNRCELPCYIDCEKLHAGNNYGKVLFLTTEKTIEIPISIIQNASKKDVYKSLFERKKIAELTSYYIDFRSKKMHATAWLAKSMDLVEDVVMKDEKNCVARLFQAQLLITKERYNEAKWILDHVAEILKTENEKIEVYCYYLYLTTLYNREEVYVNSVAVEIEDLYKKNTDNWKIAWLLLYLKEEYSKNAYKRWELLESLYQKGCTSPIIYLEALHLIHLNPEFIKELTGFYLQILFFATQRGLLEESVVEQIHYLIGRVKEFNEKLLQMLISCYEVYEQKETLHAICTLLIKGNKTEEKYFAWYALGVKEQLRITRLYEYYMLSISCTSKELLPKSVLMYFAYNSTLPYEKKAFLYASVLRNEDKMPEMARSYKEQIEEFVKEQILAEHLNRDLAYLYQEVVHADMLTKEIANALITILFYHEVTVENEKIKQVIVIQDKVRGEVRYPLMAGKAYVSIYSSDYEVLLQDIDGNRYSKSIPYMLEKMLIPRKLVKMLQPYSGKQLGFDIFVCESVGNYNTISLENAPNFERIIASDSIRNEFKKEIRTKLVQYHYDNDQIREMDDLLNEMDPVGIDKEERMELIKFMVSRGMYEKAFDWVKEFGEETIRPKTAFRLASRMLAREQWEADKTLLELSYFAFQNTKYDEHILRYLSQHFKGMTRELRDIWKAANNFDIEVYYLTERILMQILFSQAYIGERTEIFKYYCKYGMRSDIKKAFLTFCAYEYFVKERMFDADVFLLIEDWCKREETEETSILYLALLKYFSEHVDSLKEEEIQISKKIICSLLAKQIYFAFFMNFVTLFEEVRNLMDRTIIEYRAKSNAKVTIHYVCQKDNSGEAQYRKQEMTNMYGGIFVKSFILFFGEHLQYYITEENDGQEQLTESAAIYKSDVPRLDKENRFTLLNDVVLSKTLQDFETLDKLMEEYMEKSYMVTGLFEFL